MKISINEPCHENWEAMTPNTQGAFCKSCAKDVVDFSKMGIAEIKSFFSKPQSGKTCGRFEETQLQELTFDDFFAKFTYWNFAKKFAVIFFFTFGFALFSTNVLAQDNRHMMKGEVMVMPDKTPKKDTARKQNPKDLDRKHIMGKVARNNTCQSEPVKQKRFVAGDTIVEKQPVKNDFDKNENIIMGMIAVRTQPKKDQEPIKADTTIKQVTTQCDVKHVLGQVAIYKTEIINPVPVTKVDSVTTERERTADNVTPINIYPNPSAGNLIIETNSDTKQTVHIYDETGKIVLTQNIIGTTTIDVSGLNNGVYNVIIMCTSTKSVMNKRIVIVK